MISKPLPFYGSLAKRLIEVHKGESSLVNLREREWREAVEWLEREIWSECIKDHNIQLCGCQVCKQRLLIESLIDTAFAGGKE